MALAIALTLKLFCFDFTIAQGNSMEPVIHDGTVLVVNRAKYGLQVPVINKYLVRWSGPKPGEVVVFYTPSGDLAVKRCISLGENGYFYAEGDNSITSYDSRSYGPVNADNVIGKVLGY